jgi:excisionase family DNA binding protein
MEAETWHLRTALLDDIRAGRYHGLSAPCPAAREAGEEPMAAADQPEDLVTVAEAARLAGVSPATVQRWIRRALLPAHATPQGRRVSSAAVRAVATDFAHPIDVASEDYVLPFVAARLTGVPRHRISYWSMIGKVASTPGRYGRLVRLADVQALATEAQRPAAAPRADDAGEPAR